MTGGEVIQLKGLVDLVLHKVADVIQTHKKLDGKARRGLQYIRGEMRMVTLDMESSWSWSDKNHGHGAALAHETKIVLIKELAFDMEDFIDLTWVPAGAAGLVFAAIGCGLDPRPEILRKIEDFKDRLQRVRDWKPDDVGGRLSQAQVAATTTTWSAASATTGSNQVGMGMRVEHLGQLLSTAEGQPRELRVISMVGCRGVGKTALAWAVYDAAAQGQGQGHAFPCRAWVVASECNSAEHLLGKIQDHPDLAPAPPGSRNLRDILQKNRYLIVIDDLGRADLWHAIKHEFPENRSGSRIIVTTSVRSVAAECSRGSYVYPLQGLDQTDSKKVFWETVGEDSPALKAASDGILMKCGGLPPALVSAANYLRRRGRAAERVAGLTTEHCQRTARALGDMILQGRDAEFVDLRTALLHCYSALPDHVHRSCLLYASVFPRGHPINSKVLTRRWIAEGLVNSAHGHGTLTDEEVATGCLEELIDRSIVEPVVINDARVAMLRVYSVMLEFIIHKAVSENFVALLHDDELLCNRETQCSAHGARVRRLSVQDSSKEALHRAADEINLSAMRSLTIFRSHLLHIHACKLLRVLDLGGCKGVQDIVGRDISELKFLKYLSLRDTDVGHLPKEIGRLRHLETLDIRDTGVEVVPTEVIMLPFLAHLFGRFKLHHRITEEMLKGSRLQTLAGVVVNKADQSFEKVIRHARKLRDVKIYQTTASDSSNNSIPNKMPRPNSSCDTGRASSTTTRNSSLCKLKERFTGRNPLQRLSIDSSDLSTEFVSFLQAPCALTSIKLRGKLESLPATPTLRQLVCLNKLLLISTGLSSEALSALQSLHHLEYLKLAEHDGDWVWAADAGATFVVHDGGFPSLKRLCFEAPNQLPRVIFRAGSMKSLAILDLLSPCQHVPELPCLQELHYWCGVKSISDLTNLGEVNLHHSTDDEKMRAWKDAAIWHKNMPSIKRQPRP